MTRAAVTKSSHTARRLSTAECERRGWHLVELIEDAGFSAKNMKRPGVEEALRVLKAGEASALVVAKLDRLSRSMIDFTALMGTAQRQSWALVALDCAVDTSTPTGEAMANMLATFAQSDVVAPRRGATERGVDRPSPATSCLAVGPAFRAT